MGPNTFLLIFLFLFTLGILLIDIKFLNQYDLSKKIMIKLFISIFTTFILWLVTLADRYSETRYSLKKFVDYYGLRYGDTIDFNYHIKTDHTGKDKGIKTPICKIDGNISDGKLNIKTITNCDTDEGIVGKYKKLFTSVADFTDTNTKKKLDDSKFSISNIQDFIYL